MPVNFEQLDYWMIRGFSGILAIVQERLTRVKLGFCERVRQHMAAYTVTMQELNEGIQCREQEIYPNDRTSLATIDEWYTRGFSVIDKYLDKRSRECKTPMSEACLYSIEEHIQSLQETVKRERDKCQPSSGMTGS